MEAYYPMLWDAFGMFLFLGVELSILFILISFGVSLLQKYIPDSKIQKMLDGRRGRGYFFAAGLGAITPFCSCSTIPMLRGLLKAKAGFGPTMTFLFCSPLLNPIIIGLFLATFGTRVTLYYFGVAFIVSIVSAFILDVLKFDRYVIPEVDSSSASCCEATSHAMDSTASKSCCAPVPSNSCCVPTPLVACCAPVEDVVETTSCCCGTPAPVQSSCCGSTEVSSESGTPLPFRQKSRLAFGEAINQFKSVFIYLLLGVALGAFVYGFVPSDFIAKYASGDSVWAIPIAAIIGIPLYVRTEVLIPLSAALASKGMGLGAIMALIIGGGGASITEVILLKSMFRMPMICAFLIVILGMAIMAGILFQYVL